MLPDWDDVPTPPEELAALTRSPLAEATEHTRTEAARRGRPMYLYEYSVADDPENMLDGDPVAYGSTDDIGLDFFIRRYNGESYEVLRVALPDGTVTAVNDPRDEAARLAAFCANVTDAERADWARRWDETTTARGA